jgi:hypothetical protein
MSDMLRSPNDAGLTSQVQDQMTSDVAYWPSRLLTRDVRVLIYYIRHSEKLHAQIRFVLCNRDHAVSFFSGPGIFLPRSGKGNPK